ncbi:MAG: hypothetical protein M3Z02_00570 [Actinomycetota bacterium]|nr:hypothetical protein [Actinomycetota bacterium]
MLSSITPLGERGRSMRWGATVSAYVVGSTLSGGALGALAGAAGSLLRRDLPGERVLLGVVALACLAGAALDLRPAGRRVPSWRRQVDEDWLHRYRGWVYGIAFGAQLGLGVVTIVTTWSVYLVWLLAVLSGQWLLGTAIGAGFGLARAMPTLLLGRVGGADELGALFRRLHHWAPGAVRGTAALQLAASAGALVLAGGR